MRRSPTDVPDNPAESIVQVPGAPVGSALLRLVRAHTLLGTSLLAQIGLVPPQELVLLRLEEHGSLSQGNIVRFLNRDRSTVSATLGAMERAGLITRAPSPTDGRALDATITERGRELCPAVRAAWAELEERTFGQLTEPARAALISTLSSARDAVTATIDRPSSQPRGAVPKIPS